MDGLDWLQWPAMAVTVAATWFTASADSRRRKLGFAGFLLSNALWMAWGWVDQAWALVCLQLCLAALNIRGAGKNARQEKADGLEAPS